MISVVVSCTERKSLRPAEDLRLRSLPIGDPSVRSSEWIARLSATTTSLAAADLYQGEHWAVAQTLAGEAGVSLYVASAGYGLIQPTTRLASYSATFAARSEDGVVPLGSPCPDDERRRWWNELRSWPGPDGHRPSIAGLAAHGPVVLAMSGSYAMALRDELNEADVAHPGSVILVSCGGVPSHLEQLRVPGDARLRHYVGGSLQALNARVAMELVRKLGRDGLTRHAAAGLLGQLLNAAPPQQRWDRQVVSDAAVMRFIRQALAASPGLACTPAHRRLRDAGIACEQRRFRALFQRVVNG